MATNWTVPGINNFVIGTDRDKMNVTDWVVMLVSLKDGSVTDETSNVTIAEIIMDIDSPAEGTVKEDVPASSKIIPLEDGDGDNFSAGMKIKVATSVGDEYREIRQVSGDTLVLWRALKGSIDADTDDDGTNDTKVTQVGNSGDYNVTVDSSKLSVELNPGENYQFQVKSDSIELDIKSAIFHAISYDMDNLKDDVNYMKKHLDYLANGGVGTAQIYI